MKALITGATGFIGSHLVEALIREGFEVTCLVRDSSNLRSLEGLPCRLVTGDCTDRRSLDSIADFDYIYHLAGLTKASSEEEFSAANVRGTENILDAALRRSPHLKRFLYLSSLAAAGPCSDGTPLREEIPMKPVSHYGKSKGEGEKIVLSMAANIPVTVIRPPAVYGPRDKDLLVLCRMVKGGFAPSMGRCSYSFIYVDDLVSGIINASQSANAEGEIFYLSDGSLYSQDEIVDAIAEAVGKRPFRVPVPRSVMPLIGFLSEKMRWAQIINTDKIREITHPHWVCDTSKAVRMLGFEPKVKIKEGVKWTVDWYRIHQWL
ncbi:MAG: NAD(P)-dependent oxidoreductase [Nitrospirales bacterium]|nr:NAD(P)-dependent oxidoreductase [Nitrospirales bacterium]